MRLPDMENRTLVLGETGTGKTVFSCWLLANQDYLNYPWTVIDYKGDKLITEIFRLKSPMVRTLKIGEKPPKKPGLYRLCPDVDTDDQAVLDYLLAVYKAQNHGLFIDEGYAIPNGANCAPLNAIFTQGRARNTPVICCYQRPVFMSRYAVAQASFISHFEEDDERDLKTSNQFIRPARGLLGQKITVFDELPKYWSLWYDKGARRTDVLKPCPPDAAILRIFRERLGLQEPNKLGAMV